jgi:hypothetical protein
MLMPLKVPTVFKEERLNNSNSNQLSDLSSLSLPKQFDAITKLINISLL